MIKSQIMKNETVQPNTRELEKLKEILPNTLIKREILNLIASKSC